MSTHVTIDDSPPTCIGVHYDVPMLDAITHFESVGFRGITTLAFSKMERRLDCNEARRRALNAAMNGEGKCFWSGSWDYSAGRCALYKFDYTSFDGPKLHGEGDAVKLHADWEPSGA